MLLILLLEKKCVKLNIRETLGRGGVGRLFVLMFFFVNGTYMRVFTKESQDIYFLYILVLEFSHKKFRSRDSLQKFYFLKG